ncbi:MAG: hypothetical protein FWC57_03225 [Endomicrobia bacterium]|nr:hypothetical protein [Endomicrobiia bacterium]
MTNDEQTQDVIYLDGCEAVRADSEKYLDVERRISQLTGKNIKLYLTNLAHMTVFGTYNKILRESDSGINIIVPQETQELTLSQDELLGLAVSDYFFGFSPLKPAFSSSALYGADSNFEMLLRADEKTYELTGDVNFLLSALRKILYFSENSTFVEYSAMGGRGSGRRPYFDNYGLIVFIRRRISALMEKFPNTAKQSEGFVDILPKLKPPVVDILKEMHGYEMPLDTSDASNNFIYSNSNSGLKSKIFLFLFLAIIAAFAYLGFEYGFDNIQAKLSEMRSFMSTQSTPTNKELIEKSMHF